MTTGFRTLFLAREATWEGWREALKNDWVVAVRRDAISGGKLWTHGGSGAAIDFVARHEEDWRWWDNPGISRPLVSVVAVRPGDTFEAARPESGITIRVRCSWENTPQGLPKKAITELVSLTVDGSKVAPAVVTKRRAGGPALADTYHEYRLPDPSPGEHTSTATVRLIESGAESTREVKFVV
jgi:hypothetical protein